MGFFSKRDNAVTGGNASFNDLDGKSLGTPENPIRLLDFNNFFSFTGGGVKTYHMHKLEYFGSRKDVHYTLVIPSTEDRVDRYGLARVRHLRAPSVPVANNYRLSFNYFKLRKILKETQPDLIEVGGPYLDPFLVTSAAHGLDTILTGFWHTDYPTAYLEFYANRVLPGSGRFLRELGWGFARKTYGRYKATFAAADCVVNELDRQQIPGVIQTPLGVDIERFNPRHADPILRREVGAENRPLIFFPHRLLREKGIHEVVAGVPAIAEATGAVFVFAGTGPELPLVQKLTYERDDCHYIGYIKSPDKMARWYASSDMIFGLSAWETFGLSIIEAMASGVPVVGADQGAARDWITRANCGKVVPHGNTKKLIGATIDLLNQADLKDIGRRGRQFVETHFSWPATFDRLLQYYQKLILAHRTKAPLPSEPIRLVTLNQSDDRDDELNKPLRGD